MTIDYISANIPKATKESMEQKFQSLFPLSMSLNFVTIYTLVGMTMGICTLVGFVDGVL